MGKTILFDYSVGDPLLPQVVRAESCCQKTRPSVGHGGEACQGRRRKAERTRGLS